MRWRSVQKRMKWIQDKLYRHAPTGPGKANPICCTKDQREIDAIRKSGLFDADWYRRTQVPTLPTSLDPVRHYLQEGAATGLQPSPLFDGKWYLTQYRDLSIAGVNPLLHYVEVGQQEGRTTRNLGAAHDHLTRPSLSVSNSNAAPNVGLVAVVVHAYYPAIFDEICGFLRNIPVGFTLYVGVQDLEAKSLIEASVARQGLTCRLICRVTPNRGRNFSTLFVTFAQEVLLHDIVLHLHTKKSLYTGAEQFEWRDSLYQGLFGSTTLVRMILRLFEQDDKLGLFYPSTFRDMPYWAHHWLRNAGDGFSILKRLGIKEHPRSGYFEYPVGGMFWARVDSIRKLLEVGLSHDDFQEEMGQTDGTLAHAIERVMGILPRALGFGFVEFDYETGEFRKDWGALNAEQYCHSSFRTFEQYAQNARIISFDIFDTLIVRPAMTPDSVLRYIGHKLSAKTPTLADFFDRRKEAESIARRTLGLGDVNLDEIYSCFVPDINWTTDRISEAASIERKTDGGIFRLRSGAKEMVQSARNVPGSRVIAISDTYYTREEIDRFLEYVGLADAFDAIYISSAARARKDRGDLWTYVMAAEGVPQKNWLHVGDNEQSDVQAASDLGIRVFHVMQPAALLANDGFVRRYNDESQWAADLVTGPAMLRVANSPFRDGRGWGQITLRDAHETGFVVFGPIIFTFISWLIRHPALKLVESIYFLSREGFLLHRIYNWLRESFPQLDLPPGHYFYTSRRSTIAAAQANLFQPERITAGSFQGTLQDLLSNRLGLETEELISADWQIQLPRDQVIVHTVLATMKAETLEHARHESESMAEYARSQGMSGSKIHGLVDIGYSATIQTNLQDILGIPLVGFYMGTFDQACQVETKTGCAFGCFAEGIEPWSSKAPILQHSLVMEAFLTAPHGQVLSFTNERPPQPKFKKSTLTPQDIQQLEELHAGTIAYCEELLQLFGVELLFAEIDLLQPQEFFRMLVTRHLQIPNEILISLSVEDDFCGNGEVTVLKNSAHTTF